MREVAGSTPGLDFYPYNTFIACKIATTVSLRVGSEALMENWQLTIIYSHNHSRDEPYHDRKGLSYKTPTLI
jgi:hypothetical protein